MPVTQLTTDERDTITHLHMNGHSNAEIGRRLGRHPANAGVAESPATAWPNAG